MGKYQFSISVSQANGLQWGWFQPSPATDLGVVRPPPRALGVVRPPSKGPQGVAEITPMVVH